jgi:hypothetical protein
MFDENKEKCVKHMLQAVAVKFFGKVIRTAARPVQINASESEEDN